MRLLLLMLMPFISFSQVIYSESAEGTTLFTSKLSGISLAKQSTTVYGITVSKDKHYSGYQSARFELRDTDPMNNSGTRAEIVFPTLASLSRWYSYALLFDSANYKKEASNEVI